MRGKDFPSAKVTKEVPKARLEALKCQEVNVEMPFPCSQHNCMEFHANLHGFCNKHRFNHVWRKACVFLTKCVQWLELAFLLSIQAAAEIQSRVLLTLILLSLLPVTCLFLEEMTGISGASICVTLLVVAVGTCVLTAKRLDAMQQMIFNAGLETEAKYFQVLQPRDLEADSGHLVQLSTLLNKSSDDSLQVQHTGVKDEYIRSRRHASRFQSEVCDRLASISSEIFVKITPLAELQVDDTEVVDILHCDVWCDTLPQVQQAWEALHALDVQIVVAQDLFAATSSRKCIRVVVSLDDNLATVFLLEKSLSSLPTQTGALDVANSLGLLDKTEMSSWETAQLQREFKIPRAVLLTTFLLRVVAHCLCVTIATYIHILAYYRNRGQWSLSTFARVLPFWTCAFILLWELRFCLCCLRRRFRFRPRPTQVWYRKYLGIQGSHYAFKVAALQMITVLIQGLAKANLFGIIQASHVAETLRSDAAVWCFLGLLLCNILFPALVFAMPNSVFSRVLAALMDAVLDSGYIITTLWLYIRFGAMRNLDYIFVNNFFNYAALYTCAAHVLCVCRSLESADWDVLLHLPRAEPIWGAWKRILFAIAYALSLMLLVGLLFRGTMVVGPREPGLCPPCECSRTGPTFVVLELCVIPRGYVAEAAEPIEFNLTNRNITRVLPDAFVARGAHQPVRALSLRGNHLTELPDQLFNDLLEPMGSNRLFSWDMDLVDLAHNRLTQLPPNLFQTRSSQEVLIETLDLGDNRLTVLPSGVFDGVSVYRTLRLRNNHLTQLRPESFQGLSLVDGPNLDLSGNKLRDLPPRVFDGLEVWELNLFGNRLHELPPQVFEGLKVKRLHLQNNSLTQLHWKSFQGMQCSGRGRRRVPFCEILDLSSNTLHELPPKVFEGLDLKKLHLQNNSLTQLHPESFQGLKFFQGSYQPARPRARYYYGTLDLSGNKLQELPPRVFEGLNLSELHLQNNSLTQLHPESFRGLAISSKKMLDLSGQKLRDLPPRAFDGLKVENLHLQNNDLVELHSESFQGIEFLNYKSLSILDLSGNKLQELPPKVFDGLRVYQVNLQSNGITQLHAQSFHGLELTSATLDLSGQKLRELPPKVFEGLKLKKLQLQHNDLMQLHPESFKRA